MHDIFLEAKEYFHKLPEYLFTKKGWHIQDIMRLIRRNNPDKFMLLDKNMVWHLCNGGDRIIKEYNNRYFFDDNTIPTLIHFAGGTWKKYKNEYLNIYHGN